MHIKKLLAVFLSTAMFITSGFSTYAVADTEFAVEASAEASSEETDEATGDASLEEQKEEEVAEEEKPAAASEEDTEEKKEEAAAEETTPEAEVPDGEKDASDDASSEGTSEETSEEAKEAEPDEAEAEEEADVASTEDSEEELIIEEDTAETSEEELELIESVEEYDLFGGPTDPSSYLAVDADGILRFAAGKTKADFTATAIIPKEAKVIPAGLFDCNDSKLKIIKFEPRDESNAEVKIEANAFKGSSIVTFDAGTAKVTEVGASAFKYSALKNISSLNYVTVISEEAFLDTNITSFTAENATTVGYSAFNGCKLLSSVSLPSLVTIDGYAFSNCSSLDSSFGFANTIESIGTSAFIGCNFTSLDLSKNATSELKLGTKAFEDNASLTTVVLPSNVTILSNHLFYDCKKLSSFDMGGINSQVIKIDAYAFGNCTSLETFVAQKQVRTFADKAFDGCSGLKSVTVYYPTPNDGYFSIAEEAFPTKTGVTMRGYGGKVQTYAEHKGYTYKPLRTVKIATADYDAAKVAISIDKNEAIAGEKVTVTITPKGESTLKTISIQEDTPVSLTLNKVTDTSQVFVFYVPDDILTISELKVKVEMTAASSAVKEPFSVLMKSVDGDGARKEGDIYVFDTAGKRSQLVIKDSSGETSSWLWKFSSKNSSIATVSNEGVIRAVKAGNTEIIATLKSDTSKVVPVIIRVKDSADIAKLKWDLTVPNRAVLGESETIGGKTVPVLIFNKDVIKGTSISFDETILAYALGDTEFKKNLVVATNWKSVDTSIASVSTAKSETNTNTITVKKGAVGETMITVSVTNIGEKEPADSQSFIIKVIDYTPRLTTSKITVNSLSTVGTPIKIIPVYDTTIAGDDLHLYYKKTDKKGMTVPYLCGELEIYPDDDGQYYIYNPTPDSPFTATYKGANQLYIIGYYEETGESFEIPIPELTVTKSLPNPTIKTTGKINLFYNNLATDDESGAVKITQSIKDVETNIVLVSAANYKKPGSESTDKFANNFNIEKTDNQNFVVTRSGNVMMKDGKNNVVSGYLKITYKGYKDPVYKAIKIPTYDTAPSYVLSKTSATASTFETGQEYDISLLDKKTKAHLDLSTLDESKVDGNYIGLGFTSATTDDLFEEIENADAIDDAQGNNYIALKVKDKPRAGKAVFYVQLQSWSRPLTYTFTLKTTSALPTVKAAASTITLNKSYKSRSATINFTDNQEEAELWGFDKVEYTGNRKYLDSASLINVDSVSDKEAVTFSLPNDATAANVTETTYTYKVYPLVKFKNSESVKKINPVTVKVSVTKKTPSIKLKTGTLTFNTTYVGREEVATTYTLGNLPTGETGEALDDDVAFEKKGNVPVASDLIYDFAFSDGEFSAILKDDADFYNGKTLSYYVTGLKVKAGSDIEEVPKFKVSFKIRTATPSVKIKASGSINPVDLSTKIIVTSTVSNVVSDVASVDIWEKNSRDGYYRDAEGNKTSKHFEITPVAGHNNQAQITVKNNQKIESGVKYNVTICYKLTVGPEPYTVNYTIAPKQVIPQIKVGTNETTIYAGQSDRTFTTTVKTVPGKTEATTINAVLDDIEFASGTDESIKKAFGEDIAFDVSTGNMTLELKNPSALVLNKTYTLNLVTKYKNQADGSTANKFTIKVTVKK